MKKIIKALSVLVAPTVALCAFFTGCKGTSVDIGNDEIMQDINVAPSQTAVYEQATRSALEEYQSVADKHMVDGDVDNENEEVVAAASKAAAKLFAYACYNERYLDKYVYFSNQEGLTNLGTGGSANATRQEYYLRVNETGQTCGYRYHYTIKKVMQSSGLVSLSKSLFESARIRLTDETDLLYRFEGDNIRVGEYSDTLDLDLLTCDWSTGSDWGKSEVEMVKGEYIAPEDIEADIVACADSDNKTIRANINILAENIVKSAVIFDDDDGCINVMMTIDTEVANADQASYTMLRNANSSDNCTWTASGDDTGLMIFFRIWGNGLFRSYTVSERWSGKISGFNGSADSTTVTYYSYSDRDCDMTAHLEMLEAAKTAKG